MKNLTRPVFRPLLWMVPGFAFTVFGYWYPTWVDRSIPESADSRIWMLVAFTLRYTLLAAASVVIAYVALLRVAFRERGVRSLFAVGIGFLMFLPSAWLTITVAFAWLER